MMIANLGRRLLLAIAASASLWISSASACLDDTGCIALNPAMPSCCCARSGVVSGIGYASQNACLCANGYASYCGATPLPPGTCAEMGMEDAVGAPACPGDVRCSGIVLGGFQCRCPAGQYWDVDACITGAPPPPPGDCTAFPPASWDMHRCGEGPPNCSASELPAPPPPTGTTFTNLTNKMAACCGRGWGENTGGARKLDCIEAVAPAPPPAGGTPTQTFLQFYMAGAAANDMATAGLAFPNQMFVLDRNGIPLNGYYTTAGVRCRYRDPVTSNPITLTAQQQLAIFRASITNTDPTLVIPAGQPATVDPNCCYLAVFAMERRCPTQDVIGGVRVAWTDGASGTRRCTAAKQMKLNFGVVDLCDPSATRRTRFRIATSFTGEDAARTSIFPSEAIKIENLITAFYPSLIPLTPPVCPATPALYNVPWTSGTCRLLPVEPYP